MAQQQVTGVVLETLHVGSNPSARVTDSALEALHGGVARARVSDTMVEVLQSITRPSARRVVMILE